MLFYIQIRREDERNEDNRNVVGCDDVIQYRGKGGVYDGSIPGE